MAKVKYYLDTRSTHSGGRYPLKLSISHHGRTALLSLSIYLSPEQWDARAEKIISHPSRAALNSILIRKRADAEIIIADLAAEGKLRGMTSIEIRSAIANDSTADDQVEDERRDVQSVFEEMLTHKSKSSAGVYRSTLTRLKQFCPNLDQVHFEDINVRWVSDFNSYLETCVPSLNSRGNHLKVLRILFNYAIDNEITTNYPFRRLTIRSEPTRKRSLTVEQFRTLISLPLCGAEQIYRDMFLLIFMLRGINIVDLLRLKSMQGDRIEYRRAKTGKLYSVKVEPEALEIIGRLRGHDYLLYPLDKINNYGQYASELNEGLHGICANIEGFPDITSYWARHTWATIASSLDIPKETIAAGLGHSQNTVTDIYIDFDMRKVDDANRRIIDWVWYGKK